MRIPHSAVPRLRLATVVAFMAACAALFGYLWVNMGGTIPGVSSRGYRVAFETKDVDNLVYDSDVMVAGVRVGKVRELEERDGSARVVLQLDDAAVRPLHDGVEFRLRSKSLIEETYVEIIDGDGAEVRDGTTFPADAVVKSVQLDDVLNSLDKPTRRDLSASLRSLGRATGQTHAEIDQLLTGLGALGREGHTVLDALEAQSEDLGALVLSSTRMLDALDTGRGQIVDLVGNAEKLTSATAANRVALEGTMRKLPGVLRSAETATTDLTGLSEDLRPVAANLRQAAPDLNRALLELPETTSDLRALLPSLDATLDLAPDTLRRIPGVADKTIQLVPTLRATLADLNPALAYMSPYGHDMVALFTNWGAAISQSDRNGHFVRIFPVFNEQSLKLSPLDLNHGFLEKSNAYPPPGGALDPKSFTGSYPRVERDPE